MGEYKGLKAKKRTCDGSTIRDKGSHLVTPEHHIRELEALYDIGQSLSSIHDLDRLLQFAIERVGALLEAEAASVMLLDEGRQELYFQVADDRRPGVEGRLRELRFPVDQGIAGWVSREGVSVAVPDVKQDPRFYRGVDEQTRTTTKSLLCVPLKTKERILGVLNAVNKRHGPFAPEDVRMVEAFANQLAISIENAQLIQDLQAAREQLQQENRHLREEVGERYRLIAGNSAKMNQAIEAGKRAANSKSTVLLLGETGTGKEIFARAIHSWSERNGKPFIPINCVGLSKELLESELFGHEKGAFTGAHQLKKGKMELADSGTIFLDEVGDISSDLQTKLLRFLQEREFERVGGTKTIRVDLRIVAATNRDLDDAVKEGRFREDLYYRLNVVPITLPPLRERKEDITVLAYYFIQQFSFETKKTFTEVEREAMEKLLAYDWPGNVRELANVIERAVVLGEGPMVTVQDLPSRTGYREPRIASAGLSYHEATDAYKRDLIIRTLTQTQGNRAAAAKALGLHRTHLTRLIKSLQID
jgi:Nif-specific regulatory protein